MNRFDRLFAVFSSNFLLFMTCAGIWGSSWLVIKFQLGAVDPVISVFYRFLISSSVLFLFATLSRMSLSYSRKQHLIFFFQGACNFSINYIITYWAEMYAPSALISMTFTLLVAYNILGMKLFFKKTIGPKVYLGTASGILGIGIIFGNEFASLGFSGATVKGLALGIIATLFASAGNLLAYKNHLQKIPVSVANTWGMFYGTLTTLVVALIMGSSWTTPLSATYLFSLFYLAIFATVIAFGAYLTLVGRIGAERAGYSSILSPVIALVLSILFEGMQVNGRIVVGLLFCLLGIFITNYSSAQRLKKGTSFIKPL